MTVFEADSVPGEAPPADSVAPKDSTADAPTSVARLNTTIRDFVARWNTVWVEGEITSWNLRAGNVFARLKDTRSDAQVSLRIWSSVRARIPADLGVGDHVVAAIKADYFVKAGDFSFTVSAMKHVGLGDQLERLEKLRTQLRQEGLFDPARKKALPFLPHVIGLITGERSDAEKDVHRNAELRWPAVRFRTQYAAVQGDRCVPDTLAALKRLDADPEVDVIIIARGGGDPQTLLGFSDERLVRAVAAASTPVVSAIGHENDHPLLDDVADLRASTPTDAAKRIVPDVAEELHRIQTCRQRLERAVEMQVHRETERLASLRSRPVLAVPEGMIDVRAEDVSRLRARALAAVGTRVAREQDAVRHFRAQVRALSPQNTLDRGYAVVQLPDGAVLRDVSAVDVGTYLRFRVARGELQAAATAVRPERPAAAAPASAGIQEER
jgi:exodeoxyribonuclease VII large subunit